VPEVPDIASPPVIAPPEQPNTPTSPVAQPAPVRAPALRFLTAAITPVQPAGICSKYILEVKYETPQGSTLWLRLNVNSDLALPSLRSKGATNDRHASAFALKVAYTEAGDFTGFPSIQGRIRYASRRVRD
jgi:hypothetical protein